MRQKEEIKKYVVKKEKRLLFLPPDVYPWDVNDYFKAITKSLPDVLVLKPEFFRREKQDDLK